MKTTPVSLCFLYLAGFALFAPIPLQSAESYLEETFDSGPLSENGWVVAAPADASVWDVHDGILRGTFHFKPYKGGQISREVPAVTRGELAFSVRFSEARGYNHFSLQVKLGSLQTAFNSLRQHEWKRYHSEAHRWQTVAEDIPKGTWTSFRIRFDNEAQVIEYYRDDWSRPVYVETDAEVLPLPGKADLDLVFGNYGLSTGDSGILIHEIDNVSFRELTGEASAAEGRAAMVFHGPGGDLLRTSEIVENLGATSVDRYLILNRLALTPRNQFHPDRMPSQLNPVTPRLIVLADTPVRGCLPPHLQQQIVSYVEQGAVLLVLDGLFGLTPSADLEPLSAILPAALLPGAAWRHVEEAVVASRDRAIGESLQRFGSPNVRYLRSLTVKDGATIHATANDQPLLLSRPHGKGRVILWAALPCGEPEASFTEWAGWSSLFTSLIETER